MLLAEHDQFISQLLVLTVQVDLVDDEADSAHDPKLLDKVVGSTAVGARQLRRKFQRTPLRSHLT